MRVSKTVFGSIMGAAIGLVMSLTMSFFMLLMSAGFIDGFVMLWLKSSAMGFAISAPIGLVAAPAIERLLRTVLRVQE